ncbi:thioredoxin-disulfide reductase [Candidatus Woesearchaeota archaeon CG_4_10_14_0_2_um_filter_33_13]|nr:MAG: thioredoxin-disulfide reductase [Candidatus Woesearchaeota archaeon CG_4_10_14_0_2_um_filter_33_13]
MYDTIIIGAGPAGLSAAIYTCRKKLKTLLISVDVGGQGNLTAHIENYPGALPQSGVELMDKFRQQAESFGAEFSFGKVKEIKKENNLFNVLVANGENYVAKTIILTYGKVARTLGLDNEEALFGRGVSTCATCDGPLYKDKIVAIVGGGNSALDAAEELSAYAKKVYLVHRRKEFRADEITIDKVKVNPKVELILDSIPVKIIADKFVTGTIIENVLTKEKKELPIDGLFLEIGYIVDSSMVKNLVKINEYNEVVTDAICRTSVPGVFAAGDMTSMPYKQAIIAAGEGAKAALSAYSYLTGNKTSTDWH